MLATWISITVVAILFSALFSGSEIAFVQSNRVRIEIDASAGGLTNRIIRTFSNHADMFLSTLLVGNNIVLVIYGITISLIINPILEGWFNHNEALVLIVNTIVSTAIILVTGEFVPKSAFRINPNYMMHIVALPLYLIYLILYPVSLFISWISKGLMKLFGVNLPEDAGSGLTINELDDYLQQSKEESQGNEPEENEVKIFRRAIDFKDTRIDMCMVPRNEIEAVNFDTATREELVRKFIATGLSKLVVYKEDIDDVKGYIHVSELFDSDADWRQRLKPVLFTPTTMLANKMMRRLLSEKRSMAIVVDEYGGTAGLVTLEDLVEEIFGEIEDEHDKVRLVMKRISDDEYEFSGRAEITSINEEFNLSLPESEEYNTLAGFILENREALPKEGDEFDIDGYRISIEKMSSTRIELVKLKIIPETDS